MATKKQEVITKGGSGRNPKEEGDKVVRLNLYAKSKWKKALSEKLKPIVIREENKLDKEVKQ